MAETPRTTRVRALRKLAVNGKAVPAGEAFDMPRHALGRWVAKGRVEVIEGGKPAKAKPARQARPAKAPATPPAPPAPAAPPPSPPGPSAPAPTPATPAEPAASGGEG